MAERGETIVVRRSGWRRALIWAVVAALALIAFAVTVAWIERRPLAKGIIDRQLESRGVKGTYTLERVGLRTQQISNLTIGDPRHPDVTAKRVLIQLAEQIVKRQARPDNAG